MKRLYVLFLLATVALASCGRNNYTCPVYSKNDLKGKTQKNEVFSSAKKVEKNRM